MPNNNEIKIKVGKSSLGEFVKRSLPTEEEAEAFDEFVENEARSEEIKDSLNEIYKDDDGKIVNVKKLEVKKRRSFLFRLWTVMIILSVLAAGVYYLRDFYFNFTSTKSPVSLTIDSTKEIPVGKEFALNINYRNDGSVALKNVEIKITYPDNFIYLDAGLKPSQNNNIWQIDKIGAHRSDSLKIKGKIIDEIGASGIFQADISYMPENFSSEFKKSASLEILVSGVSLDIAALSSSSALVGDENEITINYKPQAENFINNFRLIIDAPANVSFINNSSTSSSQIVNNTASTTVVADSLRPNTWLANNITNEEQQFKLYFKIKEKKSATIDLNLKFATRPVETEDKYYIFYQKTLTYEVINSDLNINLIINGSNLDQGIDFGQTLNYSISFTNKGETTMQEVMIMAVLESDFLDWTSLNDNNSGKISGNTISWSKTEIPALAELVSNDEGNIDFFLKLKPLTSIDLSKSYQVKSYVQYSINGKAGTDSKSNTIINKINSDINLSEQVRYFNDDNIAVGSGPLPPKAGETTSFKVYWIINNNLHDLNDLNVSLKLPNYVNWDDKSLTSAGQISFDSSSQTVNWQIGHLTNSINQITAQFNIVITPTATDKNKILVLLPGTKISAVDNETKDSLIKTLSAKTTKLEDDKIANTDGIVQ